MVFHGLHFKFEYSIDISEKHEQNLSMISVIVRCWKRNNTFDKHKHTQNTKKKMPKQREFNCPDQIST